MKYIIKNCPAINDRLCKLEEGLTHCIDVSDCLLKQIIEKCKKNKFVGYGAIEVENPLYSEIIQMLEIEEENE